MQAKTRSSQPLRIQVPWVMAFPLVAALAAGAFASQAPQLTDANGEQAGIAAIKRGDLSLAEQLFLDAIKQAPFSAPAHYWLGIVHLKQNKQEVAEENLLKAIELRPSYPEAYNALGIL